MNKMPRTLERIFFLLTFILFAFYLFQPERQALGFLYRQKFFLYMNRKNSEVIFGRDFRFNRDIFTYGENVVLQPGDSGVATCSLSCGENVLLFSVKRTLGLGNNPRMVVIVNDDTLVNQEIWSEEWMYVKTMVKLKEQKINPSYIQILCQRKNIDNETQGLVLSKLYIIKK